jgi:hypothetical protein
MSATSTPTEDDAIVEISGVTYLGQLSTILFDLRSYLEDIWSVIEIVCISDRDNIEE